MPSIEDVEALAKRRGFFWVSSELYGGASGFYDYGPVGTLLKRKLERAWKGYFLGLDPNFFEIDATNIMPEKVFKASGHLESFVDPVAKCRKCGTPHRADQMMEDLLHEKFEGMTPEQLSELIRKHKIRCPKCKGELGDVSVFNMMFRLGVGPTGETVAYLRPETAQGAYVNFQQCFEVLRKRLPLGLAIVGRAYRNEISPRQLTSRQREFTQAELQIFFDPEKISDHPDWNSVKDYRLLAMHVGGSVKELACEQLLKDVPKFYVYHMAMVQKFFLDVLKVPREKFRFRQLSDEEKAFYNKYHWDMEMDCSALGGFREVGGVHYRTDHDLAGHQKVSGKNQEVFFDGKRFIPHVLELSFGVDRIILCLLDVHNAKEGDRTFITLPHSISPFSVAVFPLLNKDGLPEKAMEVYRLLKKSVDCFYDDSGSIGKRYYRQDEIGTFACVTIDHDTLKDGSVTVRDRDTTKQVRVKITELEKWLRERMK
ncbi:MAG: glycine--tRNA ligase [Candidatus Aenigmatarchaeota archaeon]